MSTGGERIYSKPDHVSFVSNKIGAIIATNSKISIFQDCNRELIIIINIYRELMKKDKAAKLRSEQNRCETVDDGMVKEVRDAEAKKEVNP